MKLSQKDTNRMKEVKAIREIIGDVKNQFVSGVMIGTFLGIHKPNNYYKFMFVDMSSGIKEEVTLFEDNKFHKTLIDGLLEPKDYFKLTGSFKITGTNYINIGEDCEIEVVDGDEIPEPPECPIQKKLATKHYKYIDNIICNEFVDVEIKSICQYMWNTHKKQFMATAAARYNHHAHMRGLAQHVYEMLLSGVALAEAHELNPKMRDWLLSSILFHDIGKMWENHYIKGVSTATLEGSMLGHMACGVRIFRQCVEAVGIDYDTNFSVLLIESVIFQHHGIVKWGSPEKPRTIIAEMVHHIDNLSAKLNPIENMKDGVEESDNVYRYQSQTYVDLNNFC